MDFVPVPNTVLLELRYIYTGGPAENTLWFTALVDIDESTMGDLAALVVAEWEENIAPVSVNALSLREVYVTDQSAQDGALMSWTVGLPIAGTLLEPGASSNQALAIKFSTTKRGRSFRGRNYAMGFARAAVVNDLVSATVANAWVEFYQEVRTGAASLGWQHVVASRYSGGAPRTVGVTTLVSGYSYTDLGVDTMRGRLRD